MILHPLRASLVAALLALSPAFASAKSYTIPDPNPVAVVTIPDDWDTKVIPRGVESESEDEEVYIAIEVTEWKDASQSIADTIVWLKGKGIEIDRATEERKSFNLNGMDGVEVKWKGTDSDGPTHVSVTLMQVSETKGLVLTYWASPEGEKDNVPALIEIAKSLKAIR